MSEAKHTPGPWDVHACSLGDLVEMTTQGHLWRSPRTEGQRLKREGQARAARNAPEDLKRRARATLWKLIQRQEFVNADDVQRAMAEAGYPLPARANWLPSIFRAAAAAGKLEDTGRYVQSGRTARRAAAIKQWRCTP